MKSTRNKIQNTFVKKEKKSSAIFNAAVSPANLRNVSWAFQEAVETFLFRITAFSASTRLLEFQSTSS